MINHSVFGWKEELNMLNTFLSILIWVLMISMVIVVWSEWKNI